MVAGGVLQGEFAVHRGALVWQTYDASARRYRLLRRAGARTRTITTSARPFGGFDVAAGPRGRQVVAYSLCRVRRGCDLRYWRPDLPSRSVPGAARPGVSEGLPTVSGNLVAFTNDVRSDIRSLNPPGHYRSRGRRIEVRRLDGLGRRAVVRLPADCGEGRGRSLGPDQLQLHGRTLLYGLFCAGGATLVQKHRLGETARIFDFGLLLAGSFDLAPSGKPFANGYFNETQTRISGLSIEVGGARHDDPEIAPAIEQVRVDGRIVLASRCRGRGLVTQKCSIERATGARVVSP